MKKISLTFILLTALAACFVSCGKKDQGTPVAEGPKDTITSFMVNFYDPIDSTTEVGAYDDPDGPGPIQPSIGGVALKKNTAYVVTFMIEDATNPKSIVYIHNKIKSNGKDYRLCTTNSLGISVTAKDSDGSMPIGLVNDLNTSSSTGTNSMVFTIRYQKGVKDGQCSAGSLYYQCSLPVSVY